VSGRNQKLKNTLVLSIGKLLRYSHVLLPNVPHRPLPKVFGSFPPEMGEQSDGEEEPSEAILRRSKRKIMIDGLPVYL
jgi:hypothetical protein